MFAALFSGGSGFFLAADKVQVKYEMLWTRLVDGLPVSEAAAVHGYSRAAFYLVAAAFDQSGAGDTTSHAEMAAIAGLRLGYLQQTVDGTLR